MAAAAILLTGCGVASDEPPLAHHPHDPEPEVRGVRPEDQVSGARTRISTFLAGVFLLILVVCFGPAVGRIPMAALVAVMTVVSVATFDWHSVKPSTLKRMPHSENIVMLTTASPGSSGSTTLGAAPSTRCTANCSSPPATIWSTSSATPVTPST